MDKYENSTFIIAAVVSAIVGLMLAMSARIAEGQEILVLDTNVIAQYLLTSVTTEPAHLPTASIAIAANRKGIKPPINNPTITRWSDRSKDKDFPVASRPWV